MTLSVSVPDLTNGKVLNRVKVPLSYTSDTKIETVKFSAKDPDLNYQVALDDKELSFIPDKEGLGKYTFEVYVKNVSGEQLTKSFVVAVDSVLPTPVPVPVPEPTPIPIPVPTGVLWDNNVHGKWNNGINRVITGHHAFDPYDPLTEVAAGENRRWEILGDGTCLLSGARARVYNWTKQLAGKKYQWDIHYIHNSSLDNMSLEFFSRHNEGGDPVNRFGGEIFAFSGNKIEFDEEHWHNDRNGSDSKTMSQTISGSNITRLKIIGEKIAASKVTFKFDIYVNDKLEWHKEHTSPETEAAIKEALYWRWRTNGTDPKNVKVLLSRVSTT